VAHLCHCDEKGGCGCLILLAIIGFCWLAQDSNQPKPVPRYVAPKEESSGWGVLGWSALVVLGVGTVGFACFRSKKKGAMKPAEPERTFTFRDPPVKLTPQQVTEAARKTWDIRQLAHSLPCFGCRGAAEPVPGTENMYVCKKCGRHFTNRRHNQQERP